MVIADNSNPAPYTLARPSITTAMDIAEYNTSLHDAKREVKKAESKIDTYTAEDVSAVDKAEYAIKLREISAKVETAMDILDVLILDAQEAGIDATEANQLKHGLVHLMK